MHVAQHLVAETVVFQEVFGAGALADCGGLDKFVRVLRGFTAVALDGVVARLIEIGAQLALILRTLRLLGLAVPLQRFAFGRGRFGAGITSLAYDPAPIGIR